MMPSPVQRLSFMEMARRIAEIQVGREKTVITIDGPCASGKTTFAGKLAETFAATLIHTDDYVIPHARKTAERLAIPGGNCDAERLVREVLEPWKRGSEALYRKYDCHQDRILPGLPLPESGMLIVEGCYCNLPDIWAFADLRLFMDTPEETRMVRLKERETHESLKRYFEKWIPLENAYFEAYHLPDADCVIIS